MIKALLKATFTRTAWIAFVLAFLLAFLSAVKVHAIDSSSSGQEATQKYGIQFPIIELGNCNNLSECRSFCDDPLNHDACLAFAKKKGFYKETMTAVKNSLYIAAKSELGCDSEDSCKSFCSQSQNWQKCGEFAKKHNLGGGQVEDPAKQEVLTKAKSVLGCDSIDACKNFCQKEENKISCDNFAKLVGLRGGVEKRGPGGCTTVDTCKAYCSNPQNVAECSRFGVRIETAQPSPGVSAIPSPNPDMGAKCVQYGCTWTGISCSCHINPNPSATSSSPSTSTHPAYTYPPFTPEPTQAPQPTNTPSSSTSSCQAPASGCTGGYWDGSSCSCKSYADYCASRGGSWTGTACVINGTSYSPPPTSTPTPTPAVQGVSTVRSLFQSLLDRFR